jgi:hypothetical protein
MTWKVFFYVQPDVGKNQYPLEIFQQLLQINIVPFPTILP